MGQRRRRRDHSMADTEALSAIAGTPSQVRTARLERSGRAPAPCPARCGGCCRRSSTICSAERPGRCSPCTRWADARWATTRLPAWWTTAAGCSMPRAAEIGSTTRGWSCSMVRSCRHRSGMNPALTIASLALRAIAVLRTDWGYTEAGTRAEHRRSSVLQETGSGRAGARHADRSGRTPVGSGLPRWNEARQATRMSN